MIILGDNDQVFSITKDEPETGLVDGPVMPMLSNPMVMAFDVGTGVPLDALADENGVLLTDELGAVLY